MQTLVGVSKIHQFCKYAWAFLNELTIIKSQEQSLQTKLFSEGRMVKMRQPGSLLDNINNEACTFSGEFCDAAYIPMLRRVSSAQFVMSVTRR